MSSQDDYKKLKQEYDQSVLKIGLKENEKSQAEIENSMQDSNFWNQSDASDKAKKLGKLKNQNEPWQALAGSLSEIKEFIDLEDPELDKEIEEKISKCSASLEELKKDLRFNSKYDSYDAIISIYAGAGGTDAQDWAEMLYRMYARWCESKEMKMELIEESRGEEAGYKTISFSVSGKFAYGLLKGEHGVHRLVRLSPFNSASSRETSFAMVEVLPQIEESKEIEIDEKDLKVDVYRSSGHGGQSVNTTDSAVRVTHLPTNIVIAIQNEKSQIQNKETAMKILRSKLAQMAIEQRQEKISELKGPNKEAAWGNQIRSYVLHPYQMVKDLRTNYETTETEKVLNGQIDEFLDAYLDMNIEL